MQTRTKTYIFVFSLILALVLIAGGIFYFKKESLNNEKSKFIEYKDLKLTDSEKKLYQETISKLEKELSEAKDKDDQFRLNMQIGFQNYGLGEYGKARDSYLKSNAIYPQNVAPYAALYEAENAMGDYELAKFYLQKAIELNPSSVQYWRWMIQLRELGFHDTSEQLDKYYKDALEKTGNNVDILSIYAQFLEQKGDLVGAVAQWKKAMQIEPSHSSTFQNEITRIQNKLK